MHRMANVDDILEMWQGSQKRHATLKEPHAQHKQMTVEGYILDTNGIVKAYWSLIHPDGATAFILSESSTWPPPLSAKNLPGGRTEIGNFRRT